MGTELQPRTMALDVGERRIGIAVSDPFGQFASGLPTLAYKTDREIWPALAVHLKTYQPATMVMGLPMNLKGEVGQQAEKVLAFAEHFKRRYPAITVVMADERFTSTLAHQAIHAMGKQPSRQKGKVDEIAAVLILQGYLDGITGQTGR
jgi:putative holliday junction resolvase